MLALAASGHVPVDRAFNDIKGERRQWNEDIDVALKLLGAGDSQLAALRTVSKGSSFP